MRPLRIAGALPLVLLLAWPQAGRCDTDGKQWSRMMQSVLPAALCQEGGPILRCYQASQALCLETAIPIARQCLDDANLPDFIPQGEGKAWGRKVGACTGDRLTDTLPLKPGKTEQCVLEKPSSQGEAR